MQIGNLEAVLKSAHFEETVIETITPIIWAENYTRLPV